MKTCVDCGRTEEVVKFKKKTIYSGGSAACVTCLGKRERKANPEKFRKLANRKRSENPDYAVLIDCRKSDKKNSRVGNDLNREFIRSLTANGCTYCGCKEGRMTLDRVDNEKAHMRNNVVAACLRCNYMRGSMPFEAWMHIVPSVRSAFDLGLFGAWRTVPLVKVNKL